MAVALAAASVGVAMIVAQVALSWQAANVETKVPMSFGGWASSSSGSALLLGVLGGIGGNIVIAVVFLVSVQWVMDREREERQRREIESRAVASLLERSRLGPQAAREAFAELRASQALTSGALNGLTLSDLDLRGVDLSAAGLDECHLDRASLEGCKLVGAKLRAASMRDVSLDGANLSFADLTGAAVDDDLLRRCGSLWQATMPNGHKYRGQWRLDLELSMAQNYGLNLDSEDDFREFFGS